MLYYFKLPVVTKHTNTKYLEPPYYLGGLTYLFNYINIYSDLNKTWVNQASISNVKINDFACIKLDRSKVFKHYLALLPESKNELYEALNGNFELWLRMPYELFKSISKKTKFRMNNINIYLSIVDVIASDESMTTFKLIDSTHIRTMRTDIFRLLFNPISSSNIYILDERDFRPSHVMNTYSDNINDIIIVSLPKFVISNVDKVGTSFIHNMEYIFYVTHDDDYHLYDKVQIKGKWYNYRNHHYQHIFVNIDDELYHISCKSTNDPISDVDLYEKINVDIFEPEKLPGVKFEKTDGGFFDDSMIEVEVK